MIDVTFGGVNLTDYLSIKSISRSILPPREVSLLTVPERHGSYFTGSRYGVREINMEVKISSYDPVSYMELIRSLAFLFDIDEPTELIISDEPDKVQYAIIAGSTDMTNQILEIGRGTLTFLCPDPFAYSVDSKLITPVGNKFTLVNEGTTTTFPKFTTTFSNYATFASITSPDGIILIGTPNEAEQVTLPKTEYKLNDPMTIASNWSNAGAVLDAGRLNVGSVGIYNSESMMATDYGTGTAGSKIWHGPAVRRNLSETVKDFTVKARIDFYSADGTSALDGNQKGRLEIYLFDQSGVKIGKLSMVDAYKNFEYNIPQIYIGNKNFLEKEETKLPKGKQVKQKQYITYAVKNGDTWASIAKKNKTTATALASLNGKTTSSSLTEGMKLKVYDKTILKTVYPEHVGIFNDFYGEFTLQRIGKTWYAEVAKMDKNLKKIKSKTIYKTFTDNEGIYTSANLSYIVIHFAQWENEPVCQIMRVTDLKVIKTNDTTTFDVPQLFAPGNVLEVDLSDSTVTLDGELIMDEVDIGSTFFPVYEGTTEIVVNSDDPAPNLKAEFTERYL